jgi:hypothetical protein
MTNPETPRHVEVKDGDQPVAAAEVTTAQGPEGTARTSLHATSEHVRPGHRANLVDAVMDTPEVQASTRLEASVPLGDGELLERLRERTEDAVTRPAGSTALLDADIPRRSQPESLGPARSGHGHIEPPRQRRRGGAAARRKRGGRRTPWRSRPSIPLPGRP